MKKTLFNKTKAKPVPTVRVPVHVTAAAMQTVIERRMRAIGRVVMPLAMMAVSIGFGMFIASGTGSTLAGYVVAILAALFLVVPQLGQPIPDAGRRCSSSASGTSEGTYEYNGVPPYMPGRIESDRFWGIGDTGKHD